MKVIQCPLCSCKIRRKDRTPKQFINAFTRHVIRYHHAMVRDIVGEVD